LPRRSVHYRCLLLAIAGSQTYDGLGSCTLVIPSERRNVRIAKGVWRKRGVVGSESDVPFRSGLVVAVVRYHLLPTLPCRPPSERGNSLSRLPGTAVPCRKCPVKEPAERMETTATKGNAGTGFLAMPCRGSPWPACGVRRCGVGHYVPTSFGSPAAIACRP
jgi:hypothetical protein